MARSKRDGGWELDDAQVEELSANPNVAWVGARCLILTLGFRQELYDLWEADSRPAVVREAMIGAGIDERSLGRDLAHEITRKFRANGRPTRSNPPTPAQREAGVVPGAGNPSAAISAGGDSRPACEAPGETPGSRQLDDAQVEELAANPNVAWVGARCLILTLGFRQALYDLWEADGRPATVRQALVAAGIDERSLGRDLAHDMSSRFRAIGRPTRPSRPTSAQRAEGVVPGAGSDEGADLAEARRTLAVDGSFVARGARLWPSPGLEDLLFEAWESGEGVAHALESLGHGAAVAIASAGIEAHFEAASSAGTSPAQSRREGEPPSEADAESLAGSPFATVKGASVAVTASLAASAAVPLSCGATVDDVLDAHLVGHRILSVGEKASLVASASAATPALPDLGGTLLEAEVLRRRASLLSRLVLGRLDEVAADVPSMPPSVRKSLCLWVAALPRDPGGEITTRVVIARLGISKSSYYRHVGDASWGTSEARRAERDAADAEHVREAFEHRGFRKGARQVCMLVPRLGHEPIGLGRVRRLMREMGLRSGVREPNPARRAARSREEEAVAPNLLRRRFRLHRPNEVRVTDVTYLDYAGGALRAYGSALMDPVTYVLVAFVVSADNDLGMALETLREGDSHPCEDGGIMHSDQGVLYKSGQFRAEVLSRGLSPSMSKRGNCWDNATQESFFGHFKDEADYASCGTIEELRALVADYVDYHNSERGMWGRMRMTPLEYEAWLSGLDDDGFAAYLEREEAEWEEMRSRAADLARRRYGTLGAS